MSGPADLPARLSQRITVAPNGCWLWTGHISPDGYGMAWWGRRDGGPDQMLGAHRLVYHLLVGRVPDGLQLDHVRERGCVHRNCVNPAHLEPVTSGENTRRGDTIPARHAAKTHCPQGHPYEGNNLYFNSRGSRECRTCRKERGAAERVRLRARGYRTVRELAAEGWPG